METIIISDSVSMRVHFDKETSTAFINDKSGARLPAVIGFWFAWYAFNSDTKEYGAD